MTKKKNLIKLAVFVLSHGDQHKQWLTSAETLSCCSYMLASQLLLILTSDYLERLGSNGGVRRVLEPSAIFFQCFSWVVNGKPIEKDLRKEKKRTLRTLARLESSQTTANRDIENLTESFKAVEKQQQKSTARLKDHRGKLALL